MEHSYQIDVLQMLEDPIITFPGVKDETAQTGQVQTPEWYSTTIIPNLHVAFLSRAFPARRGGNPGAIK